MGHILKLESMQFVDHINHANSSGQGGFTELEPDWDKRVVWARLPKGDRVAIPFERVRFMNFGKQAAEPEAKKPRGKGKAEG